MPQIRKSRHRRSTIRLKSRRRVSQRKSRRRVSQRKSRRRVSQRRSRRRVSQRRSRRRVSQRKSRRRSTIRRKSKRRVSRRIRSVRMGFWPFSDSAKTRAAKSVKNQPSYLCTYSSSGVNVHRFPTHKKCMAVRNKNSKMGELGIMCTHTSNESYKQCLPFARRSRSVTRSKRVISDSQQRIAARKRLATRQSLLESRRVSPPMKVKPEMVPKNKKINLFDVRYMCMPTKKRCAKIHKDKCTTTKLGKAYQKIQEKWPEFTKLGNPCGSDPKQCQKYCEKHGDAIKAAYKQMRRVEMSKPRTVFKGYPKKGICGRVDGKIESIKELNDLYAKRGCPNQWFEDERTCRSWAERQYLFGSAHDDSGLFDDDV